MRFFSFVRKGQALSQVRIYDPRIDLKVDYDNQKVIPMSFENSGGGAYQEFDPDNMTPEMAKEMNDVLDFMDSTMLEKIERQGYEPVDTDKDRNRNEDDMIH